MKYIVYLTENEKCQVNGVNMIYIGVHKTEDPSIPDSYIGCGVKTNQPSSYMYPKSPFQYAVKKYGVNSFKRTTLFIFDTAVEAYKKEHDIVTEDFVLQPHTYNVSIGDNYEERYKPLYQFDLEGNLIKKWELSAEAYEFYGYPGSKWDSAKRNKCPFLNSLWSTSPEIDITEFSTKPVTKTTYLYLKSGKLYKEFDSAIECAKFLNYDVGGLNKAIKASMCIQGKYYASYELVDLFIPKPRTQYTKKTYYVYHKDGEFIGKFFGKELMKAIDLHSWYRIQKIMELNNHWYKDYYLSYEPIDKVPNKKYINGVSIEIYDKYGNFIEQLRSKKEVMEKYKVPRYKLKNIELGNKYFGEYIFKYNSK